MPGAGPAYGWVDGTTPAINAAHLEAMRDDRLRCIIDTPENHGAARDGSTDDTTAIQNAINSAVTACQSNGTNYCEVWFSAGIYKVSGSLVQGGSTKGNAQITLPVIAETAQKLVLVLRGTHAADALMHWNQTNPQKSGAVIQTTVSGTNHATYGEASVIGGPTQAQGYGIGAAGGGNLFSNVLVVIDGLTMLLPNDPHICGIDLRGIGEARIGTMGAMPNVNGPGASGANITLPTQDWQFGLAMPQNNNNDLCDIGYYSAEGQNFGLVSSEHTNAFSVRCIYCVAAIEHAAGSTGGLAASPTGHGATINYLSAEWCPVGLGAIGSTFPSKIDVAALDYEPGSGSWAEFHRINDASNVLIGEIRVRSNAGAMPGTGVNGGSALRIIDMETSPGHATALSVPASGTPLKNTYWRDAAITITGGTVTVITVDGTATGLTATGHTVIVPSGKTITLTYSVAPSWNWVLL